MRVCPKCGYEDEKLSPSDHALLKVLEEESRQADKARARELWLLDRNTALINVLMVLAAGVCLLAFAVIAFRSRR